MGWCNHLANTHVPVRLWSARLSGGGRANSDRRGTLPDRALAVPTSPYGHASAVSSLAGNLVGFNPLIMTKSQQRELKQILAVIGRMVRPESCDDTLRLMLYRAQTLADEAGARAAPAQVSKVG